MEMCTQGPLSAPPARSLAGTEAGPAGSDQMAPSPCPGFVWDGILASTDWVPFDLSRPDLLQCLQAYAQEEQRGGFAYTFPCPEGPQEKRLSAREALVRFQKTGQNPWTKWQVHLFRFRT